MNQHTIAREFSLESIGQHSGKPQRVTVKPAPENHGITFNGVPLNIENVRAEAGFTQISTIITVEHLLAALRGMDIDNAEVTSDSLEMPILDGSSQEIVKLIEPAEQSAPRKFIKVLKPQVFEDEQAKVILNPADIMTFDVSISYDSPAIGNQSEKITLTPENFKNLIAPARSFARMQDVDYLQSHGKALGASLKTGIGVEGDKVLNPEGLRHPNEFVRHKILDAVGDSFTLGIPLIAEYISERGGHYHNNMLLKSLMSDPENYEIV